MSTLVPVFDTGASAIAVADAVVRRTDQVRTRSPPFGAVGPFHTDVSLPVFVHPWSGVLHDTLGCQRDFVSAVRLRVIRGSVVVVTRSWRCTVLSRRQVHGGCTRLRRVCASNGCVGSAVGNETTCDFISTALRPAWFDGHRCTSQVMAGVLSSLPVPSSSATSTSRRCSRRRRRLSPTPNCPTPVSSRAKIPSFTCCVPRGTFTRPLLVDISLRCVAATSEMTLVRWICRGVAAGSCVSISSSSNCTIVIGAVAGVITVDLCHSVRVITAASIVRVRCVTQELAAPSIPLFPAALIAVFCAVHNMIACRATSKRHLRPR